MELRRSKRIKDKGDAKAPKLITATRSRTHHIESQEEKEQREFEEMKKYKFKAKPPPESIFKGAILPGVPKKRPKKPTKAKTPIALKRKATSRSAIVKAKNKDGRNKVLSKCLKALPLPDLKKVYEITKAENASTKPVPFSFEKKYENPNEVKERLLRETIEKEKKLKEFKAQPLYESSGFHVDKNLSKTCTRIEAFNITKPDGYNEKLKKIDETIDKENEDLQKKREFKAAYPYVLFEEPFVPEKDSRYCDVEEFNLHSKKRGEERKQFDLQIAEQKLMADKVMVSFYNTVSRSHWQF